MYRRAGLALLLAAAVSALSASAASAATVSLSGNNITFAASATEVNNLTITQPGGPTTPYTFQEDGAGVPLTDGDGAGGCTDPTPAETDGPVDCPDPGSATVTANLDDMGDTAVGNVNEVTFPDNMVLNGGPGIDTLTGQAFVTQLNGGDDNDTLTGQGFGDTLDGGAGGDLLVAGAGNDLLQGGPDNDTLNGGDDRDAGNAGSGDDTFNGQDGDDLDMEGGVGDDTVDGGDGNDSGVIGSQDDDTLIGGDGNDQVGKALCCDESGNDRLRGGSGADTFDPGLGIDRVLYDDHPAGDSGVTVTIDNVADDGETATGSGFDDNGAGPVGPEDNVMTSVESVTGSADNDALTGSCANNTLAPVNGDDTVSGDPVGCGVFGNDFMGGANGAGTANGSDVFGGADGFDSVTFTHNTSTQGINVTINGTADDNDGIGGTDNVVSDIERVFGGAGNDTINADFFAAGSGGVSLFGRDGNDNLTGSDDDDFIDAEAGGADTIDGQGGTNDICLNGENLSNCP